jgi:hypothetical protein
MAATSSKALLDGFASYLNCLSATHDLLLTERAGIKDELWDMRIRAIEKPLASCIENVELLMWATKEAAVELENPSVLLSQKKYHETYKAMNFSALDTKYFSMGAHIQGESTIRAEVTQALIDKGDAGGYEVILRYYEPLLPAAKTLQERLKIASTSQKWRDTLVDPTNGLNDASSTLMGLFIAAKMAQAYFTGYYMYNVRITEGFAQ